MYTAPPADETQSIGRHARGNGTPTSISKMGGWHVVTAVQHRGAAAGCETVRRSPKPHTSILRSRLSTSSARKRGATRREAASLARVSSRVLSCAVMWHASWSVANARGGSFGILLSEQKLWKGRASAKWTARSCALAGHGERARDHVVRVHSVCIK
jgi:hypothetical protein